MGARPDGRPFIAMRLVRGKTLAAVLAERDDVRSELTSSLSIFERVCRTVAYAHARGVVHRDLKPGNVMVGRFGEVQVLDWGFAKVLHEVEQDSEPIEEHGAERDETLVGSVVGTPAYMAPEQAAGRVADVDRRSDVFALGAMLFEVLLHERPPRRSKDNRAVDPGASRAALDRTDAPHELAELAKRCLADRRDERPADAGELADSIAAYLAETAERARRAELDAAAARSRAAAERRTRHVSLIAAAAVVAAVGLWAVFAVRSARLQAALDRRVGRALPEAQRRWDEAAAAQPGISTHGGARRWPHVVWKPAFRPAESIRGNANSSSVSVAARD